MKKLVLIFLTLLLAACATPQVNTDTQVPRTLTVPAILPLTEMPVPTHPLAPHDTPTAIASPQQPSTLDIWRLQMIDANVGWAEGVDNSAGYLLRTTDGGETWHDVTPPTLFIPSDANRTYGVNMFAIDSDTAWAVSVGQPFSNTPPYTVVWHTTNGGQSWMPSNPIPTISEPYIHEFSPWLQFVDEKHGWLTLRYQVVCMACILDYVYTQYRTSDGGVTWEDISYCYSGCNIPYFTDANTGYAPARDASTSTIWQVRRTLDGGQTWKDMDLPHYKEAASCAQYFTQGNVGLVGIQLDCTTPTGTTESYYYTSADQGQTWRIIPLPGNVSTTGTSFFIDMTTGWWLSTSKNGYQLERTTDGGVTWQSMFDHLPWKEGFQFVDANTGWEVVNDSRMQLLRTRDGGKTWQELTPRLLPVDPDRSAIARLEVGYSPIFESVQMTDSSSGWALGANGYIFHTTDGGKEWQDVTPRYGDIVAHREFFALDAWRAWTTVSSPSELIWPAPEAIWSTNDGGQSWHQLIALSQGQHIAPGSIQFLDENAGWFQWNDLQEFHLMKTKDNGGTWESQITGQNPPHAMDPIGFVFLNEKKGFRTEPIAEHTLEELLNGSDVLTISKTSDGGDTWQPVNLPRMLIDPAEISLDETISPGHLVYPNGVKELMNEKFSCNQNTLQIFAPDTIDLSVICEGASREGKPVRAADTVYNFVMVENYLSTDAGESWNNWMSVGYDLYSQSLYDGTARVPFETVFFIGNGTGWRMDSGDSNRSGRLQHTVDGGKSWTVIKTVSWDKAQFDFVNEQEGWALAKSGDTVSLVHTTDGGLTWEEIKPVVTNP